MKSYFTFLSRNVTTQRIALEAFKRQLQNTGVLYFRTGVRAFYFIKTSDLDFLQNIE